MNFDHFQDRIDRKLCRSPDSLRPQDASDIASRFGPLARWCLDPIVLEKARLDPSVTRSVSQQWFPARRCPQEAGGCCLLFANNHAPSLLRSAFVLPLRWRRGIKFSPTLPPAVIDLGRRVLNMLFEQKLIDSINWGLDWSSEIGEARFPPIPLEAESGWASLVAGLLVATEGGHVNPAVWASAAWRDGIVEVDRLDAKLALAKEFAVTHFFVPRNQLPEADTMIRRLDASIQLGELDQAKSKPREALKTYLQSLKVRPTIHDPIEQRTAYYLSNDLDHEAARTFYRDVLMHEIITRCRLRLPPKVPAPPEALITIASNNPELVLLGIEVFQPRRCLVLYTADLAADTFAVREAARENSVRCEVIEQPFADLAHLRREMLPTIRDFIRPLPSHGVIYDLTPGPKDVSFTWMLELASPDSWLYYLRHSIDPGSRRPDPLSLAPVVWQSQRSPSMPSSPARPAWAP